MPNHPTTLNLSDLDLIKRWSRNYRIAIWFWAIVILPLAGFTALMWSISIRDKVDIDVVLVILLLLDLLALFMICKMVVKTSKIKTDLRRNEKQVITGILRTVQVKNRSKLMYDIAGQSFIVTAPDLIAGLVSADHLLNSQVRLEIFETGSGQYLLLLARYETLPSPDRQIQQIHEEERKAIKKGEPWASLKITSIVIAVICTAALLINGIDNSIAYLFIFLVCFLLAASIIFLTYRRLSSYREKLVITGIIAECIRIRYKTSRNSGMSYINWYRVGEELIPGSVQDNDGLKPGDTACFEYYTDKKGERRELIRLVKMD